jgi:hypothetical protein
MWEKMHAEMESFILPDDAIDDKMSDEMEDDYN